MSNAIKDQLQLSAEIESVDGDGVIITTQGNAYRIRLGWGGDSEPRQGRCRGIIRAHALRVHQAIAGGRFIEPLVGSPRIVAGVIQAVDHDAATIALRSVVPMHLALERREDLAACTVGTLVNCHVRGDATFCPSS